MYVNVFAKGSGEEQYREEMKMHVNILVVRVCQKAI
jgi:hypothetical protein